MRSRTRVGLVALALVATGCGLKGPLYLPEKTEVTIRPGPAPAEAEPPAEPAANETPPQQPAPPPQDPPRPGPDRG